MIEVERVNGVKVFINPDLLRVIERTPDTVLTFTDDAKLVVKNTPEQIIEMILEFKKRAQPRLV
ncbi:MAG: flagellar FlbD family protein [Oligoflexia bacterium]|nr:flagellar FlbD family protein [Oligoflexia bacterium]